MHSEHEKTSAKSQQGMDGRDADAAGSQSSANAQRDATFFVAALTDLDGHAVFETRDDGFPRKWHREVICSAAAVRLCADLETATCPLPLVSASRGYDLSDEVAEAYENAIHIAPLIGTDDQAWLTALRIADARPWIKRNSYDVPF